MEADPQDPKQAQRTFAKALGPGLLFAGAAVGVSHLVQSTRAGATFGLALIVFVILANVFKYPAFQFGPRYAAATGTSLLEGYRRQGRWALILYTVLTFGTMLTVLAAVTFVTTGLAKSVFDLDASPVWLSAGLIGICAALLAVGRYPVLDKVIKLVVVALTLATLTATVMVLARVDWSGPWFPPGDAWDLATFGLVAGLIGWMPSAIDISIWHSLWTLARRRETGYAPSPREALLDFDIGYLGTALLALCFVILGAGVMHGSGVEIAHGGRAFASQVVDLYATTLGEWSRPIIGLAAFGVMFSTTMTVVDGFPRALAALWARFHGPEDPQAAGHEGGSAQRVYWIAMVAIGVGAVLIIAEFLGSLIALVQIATILSFLTAPALALLNHRAMFGAEVPAAYRPSPRMRRFSLAGIVFNAVVALGYLVVLLAG
ncbi:MAG: divalent metal cation transporter [Deltaproteobacteria bacterium]|nr:MAG: divalent metal cation transporter [Deltaproteobacteria bacterium]